MKPFIQILLCLISSWVLAACGFALRGQAPLPFDSLYIDISEQTRAGSALRRAIRASSPKTRLVSDATQAQVRLLQIRQDRSQRELSLDPNGRIEEYELKMSAVFRLIDHTGALLVPDIVLSAQQDMPYSDDITYAKQSETERIYRSLEESLIRRLLNRLVAADIAMALRTQQQE